MIHFHEQVRPFLLPIDTVRPHPRNPREGDVDAIVESIEANGYTAPAIVQKSTGHILAGSHRYYALQALGATEIPVIQVDVDDEQALRILLSDNRTSDLGKYMEQGLLDLLTELQETPQGLLGTAYTDQALEELLTDQAAAVSHGFNPVTTYTVVVTVATQEEQEQVRDYLAAGGYSARTVSY